jgi:hypothetical protein
METKLPFNLVVVDTPGYGDTEGLNADKKTTGLIKQLFEGRGENGIDALDAVCLVVKATDSRLTAQQKHNFNSVFQLFGKDVAKNIIIVATFCDASEPPVKLSLQGAKIQYTEFFKFNNSAFFEGKKANKNEQAAQAFYWQVGQTSFDNFFASLGKMKPVSLSLSADVLRRRENLENLVLNLHSDVKAGLGHLDEMRQEAMIMEKFEAQIKANEEFTYKVKQHVAVHKDISGTGRHTTTCLTCNYTCHSNCRIPDDSQKRGCLAMTNGYCYVCPKKCYWDIHKNCPFIIETQIQEVEKTNEDLKKKYAEATTGIMTKETMMNSLGLKFGETQMKVLATVSTIRENVSELHVIN